MQQEAISATPFFTLHYSGAIRIWHWLTFLLITASMVTVLFASTLFDIKRPSPTGKPPTEQEAESQPQRFDPSKQDPEIRAALKYRHKIWEAHKIIGFGLCFLLVSRIVIEVSRNKKDRLMTRIHKALSVPVVSKDGLQEKRHFILVKSGYLVFYVLFTVMALTGLIMAFEHTPFLEGIQRPTKEIHEIGQYLVYAYILFHLAGVVRADMRQQKGIVSAMINGKM